ncbi:MAG: TFIIB-type zinc finger domain-containing protein [Clostridia bacterium]|nr:TFIIB-type zinc finger domain-containing protein [Clostridia bacterium]
MKALVCEMCGSKEIVKQDGYFVCQACETKYSPEEAKKMMVEGTVKIDHSASTEKHLQIARRAKEDSDSENAAKYYDLVLQEQPDNWEAAFYSVYYRAMDCKIIEIPASAQLIQNTILNNVKLVKDTIENYDEQTKALVEIIDRILELHDMFFENIKGIYKDYPDTGDALSEFSKSLSPCKLSLAMTFFSIKEHFGSDTQIMTKACELQEKAIFFTTEEYNLAHQKAPKIAEKKLKEQINEMIDKYSKEVLEYKPDYQKPTLGADNNEVTFTEEDKKKAKGCFWIAAIVFLIYIIFFR